MISLDLYITLIYNQHIIPIYKGVADEKTEIEKATCNKGCPMGIDVVTEIKKDVIDNLECMQCGACIDSCPKQILSYGISKRKENDNGK